MFTIKVLRKDGGYTAYSVPYYNLDYIIGDNGAWNGCVDIGIPALGAPPYEITNIFVSLNDNNNTIFIENDKGKTIDKITGLPPK